LAFFAAFLLRSALEGCVDSSASMSTSISVRFRSAFVSPLVSVYLE
jgi:hypothetical protein